ncbi:MAG TPA: hypothetical protein VF781_04345 [Solirubrobacteraceae bacterium]
MIVEAHGLRVELPPRWTGRVFRRRGGNATLHAGDFPLVLGDGEFGDGSTARMPPGATFVVVTEYVPGGGLEPGRGLFAAGAIELPLEPRAFSSRCLAHPRRDQAGSQQFFTRAGRPLCLYVVLAGARSHRRRQLPVLNRVLRSLSVQPLGHAARGASQPPAGGAAGAPV